MLTAKQIADLRVRERQGQWLAGWWDDRFSPSAASGDLGCYGDTPEDAVRALLTYIGDVEKAATAEATAAVVDKIMDAVKATPDKLIQYECHGEPHTYFRPDYDKMRLEIKRLLLEARR